MMVDSLFACLQKKRMVDVGVRTYTQMRHTTQRQHPPSNATSLSDWGWYWVVVGEDNILQHTTQWPKSVPYHGECVPHRQRAHREDAETKANIDCDVNKAQLILTFCFHHFSTCPCALLTNGRSVLKAAITLLAFPVLCSIFQCVCYKKFSFNWESLFNSFIALLRPMFVCLCTLFVGYGGEHVCWTVPVTTTCYPSHPHSLLKQALYCDMKCYNMFRMNITYAPRHYGWKRKISISWK